MSDKNKYSATVNIIHHETTQEQRDVFAKVVESCGVEVRYFSKTGFDIQFETWDTYNAVVKIDEIFKTFLKEKLTDEIPNLFGSYTIRNITDPHGMFLVAANKNNHAPIRLND